MKTGDPITDFLFENPGWSYLIFMSGVFILSLIITIILNYWCKESDEERMKRERKADKWRREMEREESRRERKFQRVIDRLNERL